LREIPEDLTQRKGGYYQGGDNRYGGVRDFQQRQSFQTAQPYTAHKELRRFSESAAKTAYPEFNKGDMVMHTAFGKGMVLSVLKMGADALLEIAFDEIGTKKLMAKTASAHMRRL
jgi:DNA helicase-2/ATP-dependent DNA helicase PcrA